MLTGWSPPCPCQAVTPPTRPLVQAQRAPQQMLVPLLFSGLPPGSQPCWLLRTPSRSPSAGATNQQPRRTGSRALTTALSGLHASRWGLHRIHNGNNNAKLISYFGKQALLCAMDGENETEKRLLPDLSAADQASSGGDSNGPGPWEPLSSHV
jgi:hypothetical protein